MRWLLSKDGQVVGPVEASAIQLWQQQGTIQPGTLICREGDNRWLPFERSTFASPARPSRAGLFVVLGAGAFIAFAIGLVVIAPESNKAAAVSASAAPAPAPTPERPKRWEATPDVTQLAMAFYGRGKPEHVDKSGDKYIIESHSISGWMLASVVRSKKTKAPLKVSVEGGVGSYCVPEHWAPEFQVTSASNGRLLSADHYLLNGGPFDGFVAKAFRNDPSGCMWHVATTEYAAQSESW